MSSPIIDPRAKRWGNAAKWLLLFPIGFLIAPFVFTAVWGLFGLIVGILVIVATWMVKPWVFTKAANMRLWLIKHESRKNPVDTLHQDLRRQMVELEKRREGVNRLKAQTMNLTTKLQEIAVKWGTKGQDYLKLLDARDKLEQLYKHRLARFDEAHNELGRWAREIDRASDIWEAACAAAEAQESSGLTEDDFMARVKTETALDSIQTSFNTALASLDTELAVADNAPIQA